MLAIDVSRSMTANDVTPTRLARRADGGRPRSSSKVPKEYSIGVVSFSTRAQLALPPTHRPRARARGARVAAPERGHGDRRRRRCSRSARASGSAPTDGTIAADVGAADLRRRPRRRPDAPPTAARSRRARCTSPSTRCSLGTPDGVVTHKLPGGYEEQIRVPPSPQTLQQIAQHERRAVLHRAAPTTRAQRASTRSSARGSGTRRESREITDLFAGGAAVLLLAGGALSALLVPEGAVRRALVLLARRLGGCRGASPARGGRDERVPRAQSACRSPGRGSSCPRRSGSAAAGPVPAHVPARLHRRRPRRGADRPRRSTSASSAPRAAPSTPGITTRGRSSSSRPTSGDGEPAPTFRPHIGCVPATGGGGGARRPAYHRVVPPGKPTVRRVVNVARAAPGRRASSPARRRAARRPRTHARRSPAPRRPGAGARREPSARAPLTATALASSCRARRERGAASCRSRPSARAAMNFGHPLLLLTLLVLPLAVGLYLLARSAGRMQYAVRYTNVDVLAAVAAGSRGGAGLPPALVPARARRALRRASPARSASTLVASDDATVVLVVDVSGSMQATDVKPTRLVAAQQALRTFLDKVPKRVKVGSIAFAGEAQVAAPPTTDHELVREALDDARLLPRLRRHRDRRRARARRSTLGQAARPAPGVRRSRTPRPRRRRSSLVTILFLSDGHQTRGDLQPLEGAERAQPRGHPGLHGRARHAGRDARAPAAASVAAAVRRVARRDADDPGSRRTRTRCGRSRRRPGASSSKPARRRRSPRPTTTSVRWSAVSPASAR